MWRDCRATPSELLASRRIPLQGEAQPGLLPLYDGQEAMTVDMEVGIARHDAIIIAYHEHCMYLARGGREPRGRVWLAREPRGRLLPRCIDSVDTPNAARTYAGD